MKYRLETKLSPNYTPASQVRALYGQPRTIKFGAGHWWNTPEAGATHAGTVATLRNPARQASAHEVVSKGLVTILVRKENASWATNNANPYVYAIEVDPRIMWRWTSKNAAKKALGNAIFETLAQRIADLKMHNLAWKPHKVWWPTACNPIKWGEVMTRAKQLAKPQPKPKPKPAPKPTPKPVAEWIKNLKDIKNVKLMVLKPQTHVYDLNSLKKVKALGKGTWIDIDKKTTVKGKVYLLSNYSIKNTMPNGIPAGDLGVPVEKPKQEKPEWLQNWEDIKDVVMYTRVNAPLVNLIDGLTLKTIPVNTPVEIGSATTWHGKEYLITKYSTTQRDPNGIALVDLDKDPIKEPTKPAEPAPTQPSLEERVRFLELIVAKIKKFLQDKFKINLGG